MSDVFLSEGNKYPALKFENINDTHSGKVIEVKKLEDRDPQGEVKTWPNGDVRYVFVFTLSTDAGFANLWARGNMVKAIREAATAADPPDTPPAALNACSAAISGVNAAPAAKVPPAAK